MKRQYILKSLKYAFVTVVLTAVAYIGYFKVYGNFHQVDRELYRSAQLFEFNMPYYIKKYGIKSILNLRGPKPSKKWYQDELRISKELNVSHYDYHIRESDRLPIERMEEIVDIMRQAPKPLLVHCKAGADRTSLASALYRYAIKRDPDAASQISILYGHFPWLGSPTKAMDESFEDFINHHRSMEK